MNTFVVFCIRSWQSLALRALGGGGSWLEHCEGTVQTRQTIFSKRWTIEQKHYLTRASVWVWRFLQNLGWAGLVSNYQMRGWEDQMLAPGCHHWFWDPAFFTFKHVWDIRWCVMIILDDQNCSTCLYMKMSSSVKSAQVCQGHSISGQIDYWQQCKGV